MAAAALASSTVLTLNRDGARGGGAGADYDKDAAAAAWEARVLVEERARRAQAVCRHDAAKSRLRAGDGLLARARLALRREPPVEDAWARIQSSQWRARELLAHGFTLYELLALGVTVAQLLRFLTAEELVELGATYETLLQGGVQEALREGLVTLELCTRVGATLPALLRDGIIGSVTELLEHRRPDVEELANFGVTVDVLLRHGLTIRTMCTLAFSFEQWTQRLALKPQHLRAEAALHFNADADCALLGWDRTRVLAFMVRRANQ